MDTARTANLGGNHLKNGCLRYVVPFYIGEKGSERGGEPLSFSEVCERFNGAGGGASPWRSYGNYNLNPDFYDHIAQWLEPRDGHSEICRSWTYAPFSGKQGGMGVNWRRDDGVVETLWIVDMGVTLFATGVGFLWYEVCQRNRRGQPMEGWSLSEALSFNHAFKELGRGNRRLLDPAVPMTYVAPGEGRPERDEAGRLYEYLEDDRAEGGWRRAVRQPIFGIWIRELLLGVCEDIRFFAVDQIRTDQGEIDVPDKALLYCHAVTDIERIEPLRTATCLLAKGYHERYGMSRVATDNVFDLFQGCGLYISREGCAYAAGNGAESFQKEGFRERFLSRYFWIYLLMLHQTYTLLNFSRRVAEALPSDPSAYLSEDEAYTDRMDRLLLEINAFLVRSQFSSVSSIHHINDFYRYGCRQLAIGEDIDSLYDSLRSLTDMQKDRRQRLENRREKEADEKIEQTMRHLGILAIVSALCDSVGMFAGARGDLTELFSDPSPWLIASIALWAVLWGLVAYISVPALKGFLRDERERRSNRREKRRQRRGAH